MRANHVFWPLMLFYTHLLLLLQPSVLWLSIVTFNNDAKHRQTKFSANLMYHESDPGYAGYPTLNGKIWPRRRGLPGVATELPALECHLTCHVNAIKLKRKIIWTGGLPHLNGLPHLPGVPQLHVNRPLKHTWEFEGNLGKAPSSW